MVEQTYVKVILSVMSNFVPSISNKFMYVSIRSMKEQPHPHRTRPVPNPGINIVIREPANINTASKKAFTEKRFNAVK